MKSSLKALLGIFFWATSSFAIVNGEVVSPDSPLGKTVVLIRFTDSHGESDLCSGTLLSPRLVLTAAHCLIDSKDFRVLFPNSQKLSFWNFTKSIGVSRVETPGEFGSIQNNPDAIGAFHYDLGLLHLSQEAPSDYQIVSPDYSPMMKRGDEVIIAGFGGDSVQIARRQDGLKVRKGLNAGILRSGKTYVLEFDYSYGQDSTISSISIDRLKTDDRLVTICYGDSGGPVFLEKDGSLVQIAVSSRGNCASNEYPGLSTSTAYTQPFTLSAQWLQSIISADLKQPRQHNR